MSKTLIFFILLLIGGLPVVASDIYTPSVPAIALDLNTKIDLVQWSMAIYMFGMGITQLLFGPLSEGVGRRNTMILGLIIFSCGCIISIFSPTISLLIIGRFIQGCGAGSCASLWRAIFRDSFEGHLLAKYGGYLAVFFAFIIPAAPTLGGYLQYLWGWRASFIFLTIATFLILIAVLFLLKETNKNIDKTRLQLHYIASTYKQLLTSRIFIGYSFCVFLCYGAFFAWFTAGPVLLIHVVGISPVQFGWISFFGVGAAMALSSFVNGRLIERMGMPFMLRLGWGIMFFSGLLMLILKLLIGINTLILVIPVLIFVFGVTLIWPSTFASAFAPFGHIAGYAGAVYGALQIGGAAVIGGLISYLPDTNQLPMALIFMIAPFLAWCILEFWIKPETKTIAIEAKTGSAIPEDKASN